MSARPFRYTSRDEDSARWEGFPFRRGDIVISTRSKSGTTWLQMICALLVFRTADLPAPLGELSPWLDWLTAPRDEVVARLEGQTHRRFIKTHTPLDGVPIEPGVTYIVVGRHPLDMAVSLYHHGNNIDRPLMFQMLRDAGSPADDGYRHGPRDSLEVWLRSWIEWDGAPADELDSLPGIMWHLGDAWARRGRDDVVLLHYDDLLADLEGEMRRLAAHLDIEVSENRWPELVEAATFDAMRARADALTPAPVFKDRAAFFRRGSSGAGMEALPPEDVVRYQARVEELAPRDLLAWLHRTA